MLHGKGSAWFDDVTVEVLGSMPVPAKIELSAGQIENIEALTHAVALIRYRHPSDQSATLDWDAFIPAAIARVMKVHGRRELISELRELFKLVAPTVEFSERPTYSQGEPPRGAAGHLVRWRHFGLGPSSPYTSWREGRDVDQARVRVEVLADMPGLSRCKSARLGASVHRLGNDGEATVYADISQPGEASKMVEHKLAPTETAVSVDIDMPPDAYNVRLGVKLGGLGGFQLEHLSLTCSDRDRVDIDIERAQWLHRGTESLFTYAVTDCPAGKCLSVQHQPLDASFVPERDLLDTEISSQLWMHMPLALWTDGSHTLPDTPVWASTEIFGATEAPVRLGIIASAWGTLSLFYPYFADLHIDWQRELPVGLTRMAAARSVTEIAWALYGFLAALRDNHARAYHQNFRVDGLLPVALRRFGNALVVVGAFGDDAGRLPVGTEILAIDHVPALRAYDEMAARMPSATMEWSTMVVPFWLALGPVGTFSSLQIKALDGNVSELLLPHLSRDLHEFLVQESRPAFGSELAPATYYVNLELLKSESWQGIVSSLAAARVIILDMRGYPSHVVFGILGHFTDHELRSPEFQVPILGAGSYKTSFWTIRPMKPRLNAKVICLVDGRAVSAAETVLQIIHDNHLAMLVGEASAGTNGNVNVVSLPAGFSMRFTGMRIPLQDGTALQGRGIVPDHVVHPTLEGVRAGRDEILDAALQLASQL